MSNSKKVTENKGKKVGVRGKTIMASETTKADPIEPDATIETTTAETADVAPEMTDQSETPIPGDGTAEAPTPIEAPAPQSTTERPARRDPRLPEVGTHIVRKWRGHVVVVKETSDGVFKVKVDSAYIGEARSLTKAAEMALATEGITSGVNGFSWFHVGEEAKSKNAANDRRLASLTALVARLEERIEVSENRVRRLMLERNDALRQIDKVRAAIESEAAAETTESAD